MNSSLSLLTDSRIKRSIIYLSLPSISALMIKAVYNVVDTAYISMLNDDLALAAVGITFPLLLIINALEQVLAIGGGIIISKYLGSEQTNKQALASSSNVTASTLVFFSSIFGLIITLSCLLFLEPLLKLLGCTEQLMSQAQDYAIWLILASLYTLPYQSLNAISRAESNVKLPCIACIISALLNTILDPIFIFPWGLNMGVEGASIATALSQFISFLIIGFHFYKGNSFIQIGLKFVHPSLKLLKQIIPTGLPTALVQLLAALSSMAANIVMISVLKDTLLLAAFSIVQKIIIVGYYIIIGFSQGIQPLIAYTYGNKNLDRFKKILKLSICFMGGSGLIISVIYIILSKQMIHLFSSTPQIIHDGHWLIISQVACYSLFACTYLITMILQVHSKGNLASLISSLRQGLLFIPMIFIFANAIGKTGLYLSQPIADILTFIIAFCCYHHNRNSLYAHFSS